MTPTDPTPESDRTLPPATGACCGGGGPSRRRFLERGALLGAAGVAAAGLAGCTDEIRNRDSSPSHHVGGTPTRALRAEELPVGTAATVELAGRTLLLYRVDESTATAFSAVCTHQGCEVAPGERHGEVTFACPCHGSHFNVQDGVPYGGPASKPLTEFTAAVDGDWITVEV